MKTTIKLIIENHEISVKIALILSLISISLVILYKIVSQVVLKTKEKIQAEKTPLYSEFLTNIYITITFISIIITSIGLLQLIIKKNPNSFKLLITLTITITVLSMLYKKISEIIIETRTSSLEKTKPILSQLLLNLLIMTTFISIIIIALILSFIVSK